MSLSLALKLERTTSTHDKLIESNSKPRAGHKQALRSNAQNDKNRIENIAKLGNFDSV